MSKDPPAENVARAARLRAEIERLTNPPAPSESAAERPGKAAKSPREFIQEQMDKLDRKRD